MKKFIFVITIIALTLTLTACDAKINNTRDEKEQHEAVETAPIPHSTDKNQLSGGEAHLYNVKYGNTVGNISNNAFVAQDDKWIYYAIPTNAGTELRSGELIKAYLDGSERTVLSSGAYQLCLNVVNGWVYYISSLDGMIYKVRDDGTETAPVTSSDMQNLGTVEMMVVVDDYIYCRTYGADRTKKLYRISTDGSEVKQIQDLGTLTSGFAVYGEWIYYSKCEDNTWTTYRARTDGSETAKILDRQMVSMCIMDNKIYYLCESGSMMQIHCMDLDGTNNELFVGGITATKINGLDGWIYFTDTSAIYKIRTNGTEKTKLCDFPTSNSIYVNVLNDWIYLEGDGFNMSKVKTDGSQLQEIF